MYPVLYQYLITNKRLLLPGIGTLIVEREPARIDFPNRQILPPGYRLIMCEASGKPPADFYAWLGAASGYSQVDAVVRFNDFSFELKKILDKGNVIHWEGVGIIRKGLGSGFRFEPHESSLVLQPVGASKIIREKSTHSVRVGEDEKTSAEMTELLTRPVAGKSSWWIAALITGLLALTFTGWHFMKNGVAASSMANQKKLLPAMQNFPTYKELR